MNIEIINTKRRIDIFGFSGTAVNKDYSETALKLMGSMWRAVKRYDLKNKGINIWIYDRNENVFAGVELYDSPDQVTGLEQKVVELTYYAYYNHIGPYHLIKQAGQNMKNELKNKGYETCLPYIEIYGHWTNDETKLETGLLMTLK